MRTLDGRRREASVRVDTLAEARDGRAANDCLDAVTVDVGDEQAGRVRADVDRGDAHYLRGTRPVTRPTTERASPNAALSTAAVASDSCSSPRARSSRRGFTRCRQAPLDARHPPRHVAEAVEDATAEPAERAPRGEAAAEREQRRRTDDDSENSECKPDVDRHAP